MSAPSAVLGKAGDGLAWLSDLLADGARSARFLRGALEFRTRPDDIFISSYPRSGTTWLQFLLHLLANDGDSGFSHVSEVAPWYERSLALGRKTAADFERMPSPRIFKSHLPYAWLPKPARYVYAERDGRDVAVSYHQLYRSHLGSTEGFDPFFERFLRGRLQYGSWFDHVESWRQAAADPNVRIVSYDRLLHDLEHEALGLCAFLGFERSPARVAELVRACSFDAMKRDEARFDHATEERALRGVQQGAFLRNGRCGEYRAHFNPEQQARFDAEARKPRRGPRLAQLPAFLH